MPINIFSGPQGRLVRKTVYMHTDNNLKQLKTGEAHTPDAM